MDHPYNQILLFGDSITQGSFDPMLHGFGAGVAHAYQRKLDVVNRGFSGYNTEWALAVWRQLLPTVERQKTRAARVELATIFFGANDAALPFAFQHVPLDAFERNLTEMITLATDPNSSYYNPTLRLILVTPPPINEPQWRRRCEDQGDPLNRTAEAASRYAEVVRKVGAANNVPVCDLWQRLMDRGQGHLQDFLLDGLHLNAQGNELMYELLMETIHTHYPEMDPDALEMELPGFRDLSRTDFDKQLEFRLLQ
ncbi:SGNH hydrolase [Syncephalastrum racemosum]|uniref:SGNH hydrolase n=1 Tax=Syncephalastrum racemosum TaxID=13706 RepID=A0A1X2GZR5_SYNRA|nr:SGNH hydrolase [Syncephalastrum racemosum]